MILFPIAEPFSKANKLKFGAKKRSTLWPENEFFKSNMDALTALSILDTDFLSCIIFIDVLACLCGTLLLYHKKTWIFFPLENSPQVQWWKLYRNIKVSIVAIRIILLLRIYCLDSNTELGGIIKESRNAIYGNIWEWRQESRWIIKDANSRAPFF